MIKICGMNKIYKGTDFEVKALKDITFSIEDGEFVAIMGESGCGKTTLLNCIGLMDSFDSGEYYLNDTTIHTLSKRKMNEIRKAYDKIQSAEPKTGHWIELGYVGNDNYDFECSECHHTDTQSKTVKVNYCWYCGAKMFER